MQYLKPYIENRRKRLVKILILVTALIFVFVYHDKIALGQCVPSGIERTISGASAAVNPQILDNEIVLYQSTYVNGLWTGDIKAFSIDQTRFQINQSGFLFSASFELQNNLNWMDRKIITWDPDNRRGIKFDYNLLTSDQKLLLNSNADIVDYIKGKPINGFRIREKILGDIINSAPLVVGKTIYVGANDGMLHAFDSKTGKERFAYIPGFVLKNFYNNAQPEKSFFMPGYEHGFFVDETSFARQKVDLDNDNLNDKFTLLAGGLGKGGKGYYCLDITGVDSSNFSNIFDAEDIVKWEYPVNHDNDMGYSFGTPVIVKSNAISNEDSAKKKWVVIFGNGYGSDNGQSVLYILNAHGSLLKKINTGVGEGNGLSSVSVVDVDYNLTADYVYAGDLKGNLWKFDLRSSNPHDWDIAFKDNNQNPAPLFSIPGKSITSKPDVMKHCSTGRKNYDLRCKNEFSGYMVFFGTGKLLDDEDQESLDSQYIFGIWDFGDDTDNSEYLGSFNENQRLSNMDADIKLIGQDRIFEDQQQGNYLRVLSNRIPDWKIRCDTSNNESANPDSVSNAGWYFMLPEPGERIIEDPVIRDGKLVFVSFIPDSSSCISVGQSIIHEVDACTGGRLDNSAFDINNDKIIDVRDMINIGITQSSSGSNLFAPTGIRYEGRLYKPVFVQIPGSPFEMKIFSGSSDLVKIILGKSETRGLFYWRNEP